MTSKIAVWTNTKSEMEEQGSIRTGRHCHTSDGQILTSLSCNGSAAIGGAQQKNRKIEEREIKKKHISEAFFWVISTVMKIPDNHDNSAHGMEWEPGDL